MKASHGFCFTVSTFYFCPTAARIVLKLTTRGHGCANVKSLNWLFGFPFPEFPHRAISVPIIQIKKLRQSEANSKGLSIM